MRHPDWLGPCRIRVIARPQARGQCEDALVAVVPLHLGPAREARPVRPEDSLITQCGVGVVRPASRQAAE